MPRRHTFSDRCEIQGLDCAVATSHWLVTQAAMEVLVSGGNAFDAAVTACLMSSVVEPHQLSLGGEAVILAYRCGAAGPDVICGQGVAPAAATIAHFQQAGFTSIPGEGLAAAVVPGLFDALMLLLRDYGSMSLEHVLAPAIRYSDRGYPVTAEIIEALGRAQRWFTEHWPSSAELYLSHGALPSTGSFLRNRDLARTLIRLVEDSRTAGSDRVAQIERARSQFSRGFVAEAIERFLRASRGRADGNGITSGGFIQADDLAHWSACIEPPVTGHYENILLCKPGFWSQGPVVLQTLALLDGCGVDEMDPLGADFVHTLIEAMKLAYADREAWYGDPRFFDSPGTALLSSAYTEARRRLLSDTASLAFRPGQPFGVAPHLAAFRTYGPEERTKVVTRSIGDTCHLDIVDAYGNAVAATPSGGWLHGSPVIPGLGFSLSTRAQMFWLDDRSASGLVPGARPRTTLSPTMAFRDGKLLMVFGSQGADFQDQWNTIYFLRHLHHGMDLQAAIDSPMFYGSHWPKSNTARSATQGRLTLNDRYAREVGAELERRGHHVQYERDLRQARSCAIRVEDGWLRAAAGASVPQATAASR